MSRLTGWAQDAEDMLPKQRPPSMELHLGSWVPAWVLRLAAFAMAVAASLMVADSIVTTVVMLLACLTVLFWPGIGMPVAVAAFIGWGLMAGDPGGWQASVVVLGVHGFLVLTRLVGGVGWEARVEVRALGQVGKPFLVMQALAQGMLHLALALPQGGPSMVWAGIAGLAVLVSLTAMLVRALRRVQ